MRPTLRTFLYLPPLALAAGALYLVTRADLAQLDHEALTDPWLLMARDQPGEEEVGRVNQRSEVKHQVIDALLDGRLTLEQAVARFRDINAGLPDRAQNWRPPWYTEEEWLYRQVIVYVHVELADHRRAPAQAREWVSRLEAELREHLRPAPRER
jgi:hypothetical protein